jgi:hypothetical protein
MFEELNLSYKEKSAKPARNRSRTRNGRFSHNGGAQGRSLSRSR